MRGSPYDGGSQLGSVVGGTGGSPAVVVAGKAFGRLGTALPAVALVLTLAADPAAAKPGKDKGGDTTPVTAPGTSTGGSSSSSGSTPGGNTGSPTGGGKPSRRGREERQGAQADRGKGA